MLIINRLGVSATSLQCVKKWVDDKGRMVRRWDREGRPHGKKCGPHWHDIRRLGDHIEPNR